MKSSDLRLGNIVAVCYEDRITPDTVLVLEPGVVHLSNRKNPDSDRDIICVTLKEEWLTKVKAVFAEATLALPAVQEGAFMQIGGKEGRHTEYLGYILAEMQYLQRAYPDAKW